MGEIADDMLDGSSCSNCGIYFTGSDGFPVLCRDCKEDDPKGPPLSTYPEVGDDEDDDEESPIDDSEEEDDEFADLDDDEEEDDGD